MLGPVRVPFPVRGDAYTVAAPLVSPEAIERSVYNLTMRVSPEVAFPDIAKNNNIVFYGLSDYLRENLVEPLTKGDIQHAADFMSSAHSFGRGLPFDKEMWLRAIDVGEGRLPVLIEAPAEGTIVFPGEPIIQVTSLAEGFGEIAAVLEAVLLGQVANATAAATLRRHLLWRMEEWVREDNPQMTDEQVRFQASIMVHDFGMRSHANQYESNMLGRAHLLSFVGTDTFGAAYQAWELSLRNPVGTSIPALAHRTVQSWETQYRAFANAVARAIETAGDGTPIVSLVSDCYDFDQTIGSNGDFTRVCGENPQVVGVARPDSGDYVNNVLKIVTAAHEAGFSTIQPNGRIAMTTRRFIQGDAMTYAKMAEVMTALKENGFSPVNCGIFGVGGWLRKATDRDTLSAAYKLGAVGKNYRPVVKLSDTRAKLSVPGPTSLRRNVGNAPTVYLENETNAPGEDIMHRWYDGSRRYPFGAAALESFLSIKERVQHDFDTNVAPEQIWSDAIMAIQDETFKQWGRNRNDFRV